MYFCGFDNATEPISLLQTQTEEQQEQVWNTPQDYRLHVGRFPHLTAAKMWAWLNHR